MYELYIIPQGFIILDMENDRGWTVSNKSNLEHFKKHGCIWDNAYARISQVTDAEPINILDDKQEVILTIMMLGDY